MNKILVLFDSAHRRTYGRTAWLVAASWLGVLLSARSSAARDELAPPAPVAQRIAAEARLVLSHVKTTTYSHQTHIDESKGLYEVDCSGLVDLLLKGVSPKHFADVKTPRGHKRPLADDYVQTFQSCAAKACVGRHVAADCNCD